MREVGPYFEDRLASLRDLPIVGDVRGSHFMDCVEYVADKETKEPFPAEIKIGDRIARHAQDRGLIIRPLAHLNVLSPPLTLSREQIDFMVDTMRESTLATLDDLEKEGLWNG